VGSDGWPYIVPLLHVYSGDEIGLHNTAARGHLRTNVEGDPRACFEVDEPVKVFDYGRFECDTGIAYRSAIAYGRIRVLDDRAAKTRFFDTLLAKYGTGVPRGSLDPCRGLDRRTWSDLRGRFRSAARSTSRTEFFNPIGRQCQLVTFHMQPFGPENVAMVAIQHVLIRQKQHLFFCPMLPGLASRQAGQEGVCLFESRHNRPVIRSPSGALGGRR
jgi:hypothetical protein